ncbi:MAG: hypothetical protein QW226_04320, partial [Archaeoglobaceae archaeon]
KLLEPEDRKLGVSQQDLYQIYAYCRELGANKALLLYPEGLNPIDKEFQEKPFLVGKNGDIELFVRTIALDVDLVKDWSSFVSELKETLSCITQNT